MGHDTPVADSRIHEELSHNCLNSSVEYELALILKELRWITDQVRIFFYKLYAALRDFCTFCNWSSAIAEKNLNAYR